MTQRYLISTEGYNKIIEELNHLKIHKRPLVIQDISSARSHGDLSENAEYHAAREKQAFLESRIADLEDIVARAEVVNTLGIKNNKIVFGAKVKLLDNHNKTITYKITSDYESDISRGFISIDSPLARKLLNKTINDSFPFPTKRSKDKHFRILSVEYV